MPDFPPPPHVQEALRTALADDATHRYTVDPGLRELRRAIASVLGGSRGADWDPEEQVLVTAGANLAFAEVLPALADPGDEVLLLSPYYMNHGMAVELSTPWRTGGSGGSPTTTTTGWPRCSSAPPRSSRRRARTAPS